jgi:alpha-mannosidase
MKYSVFIILSAICALAYGQDAYFVDGYHGGIYGHYPVEWKTNYITDLILAHPKWRMSLEIEPETWDTVAVRTPNDYARFRSIVTDKRIEFTNPAYAQPYCYNVSGESIIRQFAYGIKSIKRHFPEVEFTTYSVEEPCFTSSLPQILKQFGFKYAVLKSPNTCWGGYAAPYGGELVNWIGPEGSSILTVPRYACEELEQRSVWRTTAWGNEDNYITACFDYGIAHPVGMTFQDAGWKRGPWLGTGDSIRNNSIYVTWREYFENISNGKTDDNYRLSQEDIRVSLMWGSQVLQRIARQVRQSENNLVMTEKMGVIAHLSNGYHYRQENLDEAWRTLMLAQHHDSWIVPYNRLNKRRTWADEIYKWTTSTNTLCGGIITEAVNSFSVSEAGGQGLYLRIYNTLGIPRREMVSAALPEGFANVSLTVTDAAGKTLETFVTTTDHKPTLLFEADVPAFGYATYFVAPVGKKVSDDNLGVSTNNLSPSNYNLNPSTNNLSPSNYNLSPSTNNLSPSNYNLSPSTNNLSPSNYNLSAHDELVLENSMYRIVINPLKGGVIKNLVAKKEGNREFADAGSEYAMGELRGFFYDEGVFHSSTETPAEVIAVQENRFEKSVRIQGHIALHPFTQTITIREGQRKIEFDLRIDWMHNVGIGEYRQTDAYNNNYRAFYDGRFKLNVLFPVDLTSPTLYKNAPFDVCRSELESTHFNSWDSIKHNIILHWVDLAEGNDKHGLALLSDHTTSYSYGDGYPLGLTVQFSGNGLWGRDYSIDAPTNIRFAIIPHRKEWDASDIHNENLRWNEPLICSFLQYTKLEDMSLINVDRTGYEISAAYLCDDDIIVRIFNADGGNAPQIIKFGIPLSKAEEIDLNGSTIAGINAIKTDAGTALKLNMPRFGLKTLKLTK